MRGNSDTAVKKVSGSDDIVGMASCICIGIWEGEGSESYILGGGYDTFTFQTVMTLTVESISSIRYVQYTHLLTKFLSFISW